MLHDATELSCSRRGCHVHLKLGGQFHRPWGTRLTSLVWSVQLQNEEEPGEAAPVVSDAPPPYSSISAENTGKCSGEEGVGFALFFLTSLIVLRIDRWHCIILTKATKDQN